MICYTRIIKTLTTLIILTQCLSLYAEPSLSERLLGIQQQEKKDSNTNSNPADNQKTTQEANNNFNAGVEAFNNKNYDTAFAKFIRAHSIGDLRGTFNAGILYSQGKGVLQNFNKAFELFLKSAQGGFVDGMFLTGVYYVSGIGTKRDFSAGIVWLKKAYAKNSEKAKETLATLQLTNPNEPELNPPKLQSLIEEVKKSENPLVLNILAYRNLFGIGMKKDLSVARIYFEKSSNYFDDSRKVLGQMYFYGIGTKENLEKAQEYFTHAADVGNSYALTWKADQAFEDKSQNQLQLAFQYYTLAKEFGSSIAAEKLESAGKWLDGQQKEEANTKIADLRFEIEKNKKALEKYSTQ
ncbi:MAG: tetratricopeptide repeat protein [Methylacidiphilales bacterium]|nr:tetratricopeptide repeat protein [Candidatus Methylacidiphilales bacterium]